MELFFDGLIDKTEAIKRLCYEMPNLHVFAQRKRYLCCILKEVKYYDSEPDFFYHSEVYQLMRDGVSDMHCMSDAYLAEELRQEYQEKKH